MLSRRRFASVFVAVGMAASAYAQAHPVPDGIYLVTGEDVEGSISLPDSNYGAEFISSSRLLSFSEIAQVKIEQAEYAPDVYVVMITLTLAGGRRLAEFTGRYVGERFAIVLNGSIATSPRIVEAIKGGQFQIDGGFNAEAAEELSRRLQATSLQ
jgi:preprotein translocase subunit SecD